VLNIFKNSFHFLAKYLRGTHHVILEFSGAGGAGGGAGSGGGGAGGGGDDDDDAATSESSVFIKTFLLYVQESRP